VADRTGRDAAHTWRFTPASVRRALDAGQTREALLAQLAEVAPRGVPQVLEQLFADAARRHGRLRVGGGASFVRSDDAPLLAEVLRDRKLASMNFRSLAPTVLATSRTPAETLKALRAAGYAPIREDSSGRVVVAKIEHPRSHGEAGFARQLVGQAGRRDLARYTDVHAAAAALATKLAASRAKPAGPAKPAAQASPGAAGEHHTPRRAGSSRTGAARPARQARPGDEPGIPDADVIAEVIGALGAEAAFFDAPGAHGGEPAGGGHGIPDQRALAEHVPGLSPAQRHILAAHIGAGAPVLVEYRDGAAARRELVLEPQWQPPLLLGSSPRADEVVAIPLEQIVRVHD
jgi:hypothetical protein